MEGDEVAELGTSGRGTSTRTMGGSSPRGRRTRVARSVSGRTPRARQTALVASDDRGSLRLEARAVSVKRRRTSRSSPRDAHDAAGPLVAIIGESGSGKTTLLKTLAGVVGSDIGRGDRQRRARGAHGSSIGYVPRGRSRTGADRARGAQVRRAAASGRRRGRGGGARGLRPRGRRGVAGASMQTPASGGCRADSGAAAASRWSCSAGRAWSSWTSRRPVLTPGSRRGMMTDAARAGRRDPRRRARHPRDGQPRAVRRG